MFSKAIFKQTLKSNGKLWLIFTAVMCIMSALIIGVFDPQMINTLMEAMKSTPMADMIGDQMDGAASLLGMLSQSFYSMQAVILSLIFVIMTANSLIAAQVDRGSMAYLLSTPTKRSTVVRTQATYLISAVFAMFLAVTVVGLASVQVFQGGIFTTAYTDDVKAVATQLDTTNEDVADHLTLILDDPQAIETGAEARNIDADVYTLYVTMKMTNNAYQAAADVLDVPLDDVTADPSLILDNDEALDAAAQVVGVTSEEYDLVLQQTIAQSRDQAAQMQQMQELILTGVSAAAQVLGVEVSDLVNDMGKIKASPEALDAAAAASSLPVDMFTQIINQQLASAQISLDEGIDFSVKDYLMLNLGAFLLMFAISGISFLFSCVFNLSKNSLALGAGIPVAFYIFQIMSQVGDSLSGFKYLSLNTLFNPTDITGGETYWWKFLTLGVVGVVLYVVGAKVFEKKDLPL